MLVWLLRFQFLSERSVASFLLVESLGTHKDQQQPKGSLQSQRHFLFQGSISFTISPSKDSTPAGLVPSTSFLLSTLHIPPQVGSVSLLSSPFFRNSTFFLL